MRRYSILLINVILCSLLIAPGCKLLGRGGKHDVHPPKDPKVVACEPGQWGGRLKLPLSSSPLTFNPFLTRTADTYEITSKLFGTLLDYDHTSQKFTSPPSGLARSIDSLPDGKTFVIN